MLKKNICTISLSLSTIMVSTYSLCAQTDYALQYSQEQSETFTKNINSNMFALDASEDSSQETPGDIFSSGTEINFDNAIDSNINQTSSNVDTIDKFFDPANPAVIEATDSASSGPNCFQASAILSLITPSKDPNDNPPIVNILTILAEDIYKRTVGPVTRRPLVRQPALDFYPHSYWINGWNFNTQIFYNGTPRVYLTKNSDKLKTYIDLRNEAIISEIDETLKRAQFSSINIPDLLDLFANMKFMQHRAGFMFNVCHNSPRFYFSFKIPLYYLLEHYYLTPQERANIDANETIKKLGGGNSESNAARQFALCHLASDKFGLGDSLLNLQYAFYTTPSTKLWFGLQATFPTAKTFTAGILGGCFNPYRSIPEFSIKRIFNLYFCNDTEAEQRAANDMIFKIAEDFLIGALDRLSTILINAPLGNGKHVALGPQLDMRHQLTPYWSTHSMFSLEGYFSHRERRFFLVAKNPKDFQRNFRDEQYAEQNLDYINCQIINTLYPHGVKIGIRPGIMVNFRHAFMYDTDHWHGSFGFDYWRQGKEKLGGIYQGCIPFNPLVIKKGVRPAAYQGKLFGSLGYFGINSYRDIAWHAVVSGDTTIFHKGIGANFTLSIRIGADF